ncbi:uncharacterized protein LDX57_010120 [Aspergillus melleus]|uniref:uncharacterized protein n=1 Tax=Aspergillus melleus TaxID=138277 RepID=UPI001E8E03ED|nr:uncharacterized protein LDX57_010120 [Aspergillus melleus]KAH8432483.1 hypothetical protein LDX57_010120 [Aspergillus melleus]
MTDISENTPLLRSADPDPIGEHESHDPSTSNPEDHSLRFVTTLTWVSLALSVLVVTFDLTVIILDENNHNEGYYMPWDLREVIKVMGVVGLSSALFSFLNLIRIYLSHRPLWLWLNLVADFLIAFFAILSAGPGIVQDWSYTCSPDSYECQLAQPTRLCTFLTLGFAFVLGINHLVLFFLRCALVFQSRFWRGLQNWRLPGGQLTVEFTIKFLRQEGQGTEGEQS